MSAKQFATETESVKNRLEGLLSRRLGNRVHHLHLVFQDAGVILRGHTTTYHSKQIAQHTVMEFSDLPILANEIEVK